MSKMLPEGLRAARPQRTASTSVPADDEDPFRARGKGERNPGLAKIAGILIRKGLPAPLVVQMAQAWNRSNTPPLPEAEVVATCESIFRTHQRNHPDIGGDADQPLCPLFPLDEARIDRLLREEPPKRRFLLKDFLPSAKVGAVVAPGGTGKSWFLLQLAVSVATGIKLADHWEVDESGAVLCLFAEDDIEEIHRRLRKVYVGLPSSSDAVQRAVGLPDKLYIRSAVGEDNLMTEARTSGGDVKRTGYVDRLALTAKAIPNLKLIIVDPTSRFRGGDENAAQDATRFVEELERLAKLTGAAVLVAHHASVLSS